jgi:hypothetical protein
VRVNVDEVMHLKAKAGAYDHDPMIPVLYFTANEITSYCHHNLKTENRFPWHIGKLFSSHRQ